MDPIPEFLSHYGRKRSWIKGSLSILCLLGLTWGVFLFYMNKELHDATYVFTVLNGLQGVFIFFFHILLNHKATATFVKVFNQTMKWKAMSIAQSKIGTLSSNHRQRKTKSLRINTNDLSNDVMNSHNEYETSLSSTDRTKTQKSKINFFTKGILYARKTGKNLTITNVINACQR